MKPTTLLLALLLLPLCSVLAQTVASPPATGPAANLFASEAPFSFTLTARMQAIVGDRTVPRHDSLAIKHAALLTYPAMAGEHAGQIPLTLVVRGNFRRDAKHCQFPPLYVDFPKKKVNDTPFAGQNNLKLVTNCQDEAYVVREYLVYKLYSIITDLSFRTRLARVTYVDSAKTRPTETRWGFLIEDEDDVARRNALREYKPEMSSGGADSVSLATMAVFEFMIGNIDWEVSIRHNVRLMTGPGQSLPRVVPYDFDHAVIVDAPYASRADNTGQRIYRGPIYPGWLMKRIFDQFNVLKPRFYALYETDNRLQPDYVRQTLTYLDKFYALINNPKSVKKLFFGGDKKGAMFASFN